MNKKILIGIIIVLVLAAIGGYYFLTQEKKAETIKIVTSFPMRGITVGQGIVNGIKLALEEVNYTVGNFKIKLVVEDDGDEKGSWKGDLERGIAQRAVSDPDVMVYLGTYNSGAAKISIPINNRGGLVQISPGNTWPGLTQAGFLPGEPGIFYPTGVRTYFRVCPTDALQGPAGIIWAKELGSKNIYIFDDGEAFGTGIANIIQQKASEIGIQLLGRKTLDKTKVNEELTAIKDLKPDAIYFAGITTNGAPELVKGIKEIGMDSKFIGPDGIMEQAFIDQSEGAAEGAYLTVVGVPPRELSGLTEKGKEFYNSYKVRFGLEPDSFSTFGYETTKVALLAIQKAGVKDRAKILEEVSKTKDFNGLFGTWSFDQNGDTTLTYVSGNIVKNGEFVFEKLLVSNK